MSFFKHCGAGLLVVMLLGLTRLVAGESALAHLVDGSQVVGRAERMDDSWNLYLSEREPAVASEQLVYWGAFSENLHHSQVMLRDGSLLVADVLEISSAAMTIGTRPSTYTAGSMWNRTEVPRNAVSALVFRPPTSDVARDQMFRALSAERERDEAWLENGDRLLGQWLGPFSAEEMASDRPWLWEMNGRQFEVARDQVWAIGLAGAAVQQQGRAAVMGFNDGSRIVAPKLIAEERSVRLVLAHDVQLETTPGLAWDKLCYVRPANERVIYLSDLEPLGFRHVPLFQVTWPYGRDRNVLDGRLRSSVGLIEKGLGMHSTSRIAYELPKNARRFQTELAIDRSAGVGGSVQLRVLVQSGTSAWREIFESDLVRGDEPPLAIDVDIAGADRIALIVSEADHSQLLDRANLLHARCILAR